MNAIGSIIAAQLWKIALAQWEKHRPEIMAKLEEFKGQVLEFIREQFSEWIPKLMKASVVAVAQSAGQLTINTADRVTDIIPGKVDDQIVEKIVRAGVDQLAQWGVRL